MATRDYFAVFGSGNPASNSGLTPTFIAFISSTGVAGTPPAISEPGSKGLYKFSYDASATMIAFVLDGFTTGLVSSDRYISGVLDPYDTFGVTLNAIGTTLTAQGSTLSAIGTTLIAQGATISLIGTNVLANGTTLIAQGATVSLIGTNLLAFGTTQTQNGVLISQIGTTLIAQGSTLVGQGITLAGVGNTVSAMNTAVAAQGTTLVAIGNSFSVLGAAIGTAADSIGSNLVDPTSLFGFLKRAQELNEGNETYTKATGVLTMSSRGNTLLSSKTISDTSTQTTKT